MYFLLYSLILFFAIPFAIVGFRSLMGFKKPKIGKLIVFILISYLFYAIVIVSLAYWYKIRN